MKNASLFVAVTYALIQNLTSNILFRQNVYQFVLLDTLKAIQSVFYYNFVILHAPNVQSIVIFTIVLCANQILLDSIILDLVKILIKVCVWYLMRATFAF